MRRPRRKKIIKPFQKSEKYKVNNKINAERVRIIDSEGEQIGIQPLSDALTLAEESKLDLVEIAPKASPPVCKLIDYGKFKYRQQKKQAEAKKNSAENTLKELKLRYCTDTGDLDTKLRHARKFLSKGSKVKFSMRFRGREKAFVHKGKEKLENIVERLSDVADVDELNSRSRSLMYLTLAPN
ncbi:translation initiation factor IF-3 [Myxosarcina sp. GI1]|uniref:translation initiation factor IF-3 n=1 Tax=Myxosarcina sp. GI1 TaxID=1541065 RepID=UPI00068CD9BF|nr:translation initiation factor IF-3 [Myxosarcina sp. GI1]